MLVSAEQNNYAYWAWRSVVHVFRWPAEFPAHIVYLDLVAGRVRKPYVTESAKPRAQPPSDVYRFITRVTRSKLPFYKEHPEVAGISEKFSVNAASKNECPQPVEDFSVIMASD